MQCLYYFYINYNLHIHTIHKMHLKWIKYLDQEYAQVHRPLQEYEWSVIVQIVIFTWNLYGLTTVRLVDLFPHKMWEAIAYNIITLRKKKAT